MQAVITEYLTHEIEQLIALATELSKPLSITCQSRNDQQRQMI